MPWVITLRVTDEHGRKLKDFATEGMLRSGVYGVLNAATKVLDRQVEPIRQGTRLSIMATYYRNRR